MGLLSFTFHVNLIRFCHGSPATTQRILQISANLLLLLLLNLPLLLPLLLLLFILLLASIRTFTLTASGTR